MTSCGSPCKDTHSMIFIQFYLISYVYNVEHGGIYHGCCLYSGSITYQVELWNIMECVSLHGEPQLVM